MSKNTLNEYFNTYNLLIEAAGDKVLDSYTVADIEEFLELMTITPYNGRKRAPKTILNYHIGLSSLWTWALSKKLVASHILRQIPRPKVAPKPIIPLQAEEVARLVECTAKSRRWHNKPLTRADRHTAKRDRAIILMIVDGGFRASELCDLKVGNVVYRPWGADIRVIDGKGGKDRVVPLGAKSTDALSDWLLYHPYHDKPNNPLFLQTPYPKGRGIDRNNLGKLMSRLGERADVHANPHRLRITALCLMAKNGMNAFQIQQIAGHSDIKTTQRYVAAAHMDLGEAMRTASPIDNL